ncbi:tol-pal system-associated acyl-CoA thioesterase [Collimonas sp.]|jgi:acyl-CoA thioester hydrolase|uniref:tol-pal system-associated acyl-CoA thioesterase n=1 Tax=Collimonas sp. TaxID=1963772 RepID=UPI002B98A1E5|nr:tol-pal system-associated acyl-CoA thioesterase [Collimonas sp.]HWX03935.1 tol-pal system-associated acyl-CoA thioesterase [Collimonas sp.]
MSQTTSQPDFHWRIRVYYEDTDTGGVVFYANYLKFFERARTEWLRAAGVGQRTLEQTDGVMFIVKSTSVDYHAPAKLDDELELTVVIERLGRASVDFIQQAWRLGEDKPTLLATGRISVACVNAATFRPQGIPKQVLHKIKPGAGPVAAAAA